MTDNQSDEQLMQDGLIQEVRAAMHAEADALFSGERLSRQQARILQRIAQDGRPGRVIAFPGGIPGVPSLLRTSRTSRWVAAAAALAFVAGLIAGQRLPHNLAPAPAATMARSTQAQTTAGTTLRVSTPLMAADAEFLGEVETAGQSRATVLQHIDALTPQAWEVEVGQ
jgi:hypothetical protein